MTRRQVCAEIVLWAVYVALILLACWQIPSLMDRWLEGQCSDHQLGYMVGYITATLVFFAIPQSAGRFIAWRRRALKRRWEAYYERRVSEACGREPGTN